MNPHHRRQSMPLLRRFTSFIIIMWMMLLQQQEMNSSGLSQFRAVALAMTSLPSSSSSTFKALVTTIPRRQGRWCSTATPNMGERNHHHDMESTTALLQLRGGGGGGGSTEDVVASSENRNHVTPADDVTSIDRSSEEMTTTTLATLPVTVPMLPTIRQYIQFALPCLALWIAGPLLSLVDTSFIGLSSQGGNSARQLAALGPATTFFDGATYLFAFLNVATTNLYSSARAASQTTDGAQERAESVVRTSARVAINCGTGLMLFMLLFTRPLLQLYIGQETCTNTPGLLKSATEYVLIRAISLPTSLLLGVLQAALLGAKDSVTPLIAILYSTITNIIGDLLLVRVFPLGLQGAAIATTLAQWAGTAALIPAARNKLVQNHNLGLLNFSTKKQEPQVQASPEDSVPPTPSNNVSARVFLGFAAPVLTLIIGKLAAFGFMTHTAAHVPHQPTSLASHQIILSLLFFCCPFFEVISQTAQTFLPPFLAPVQSYIKQQRSKDLSYDSNNDPAVESWLTAGQQVATTLLGIGLASAGLVASIATLIPAFFGYFITTDSAVIAALKPLAKYLWFGALFWAPVAVSEGVLLARLELKFLAGIYLLSTLFLPPALLKVKLSPNGSIEKVWLCFVIFQILRASAFTGRIWGEFAYQRIVAKLRRWKPPPTVTSAETTVVLTAPAIST